MEKTTKGSVVPFKGNWSDIGSWQALWEIERKDENGDFVRETFYSERGLKEFGKRLNDLGTPVLAIRAGGLMIDPEKGNEYLKRSKRAVIFAEILGSEVVNGAISGSSKSPYIDTGTRLIPKSGSALIGAQPMGYFKSQDSSRDTTMPEYEMLAEKFVEISEFAEEHGLNVSCEVHQNSPVDNSWSAKLVNSLVNKDNSESIHENNFVKIPAQWKNEKLNEKWSNLFKIKQEANIAIEEKRANKEIGSSLEAEIKLILKKDKFELLDKLDLADYFIVSKAEKELSKNDDIKIEVKKAQGQKCERCWKILEKKCERESCPIK